MLAVRPKVSKSAPPSPAAGLGAGAEGSPGHSCSGTGSSSLDPAGLRRGARRWWEGPRSPSPLHLDPGCCKGALIPVLSPPPWLFGCAGAGGGVHSYRLGERPHSSGSSILPACSKWSRRRRNSLSAPGSGGKSNTCVRVVSQNNGLRNSLSS